MAARNTSSVASSSTRRDTASAAAGRRRARRAHALDEPRAARRIGIGVAGMLLVHLGVGLALWLLPEEFWGGRLQPVAPGAELGARVFEIELSPDLLQPAPPAPPPGRFVEANPAAPENVPDETDLFAKQNQQVAQPEPTPQAESDTPAVDGEGTENTSAIVSGQLLEEPEPAISEMLAELFETPADPAASRPAGGEPAEPADAGAEADSGAETGSEPAPRPAVNAPAGTEHLLGEADGGPGSTVTRVPPTPGAEARPGEASPADSAGAGRGGSGYFAGTAAIDPLRPRERPRLAAGSVQARTTPTIKNELGTKNIGVLAYDAKWSAYGEYLQRLIDAVQVQWERLLLRSEFYPTSGARVKVTFKLDAAGEVMIVALDGSGGEMARWLCVNAIAERAPYGEWPEDMIAVLGREQELTFTFHYQ